MPESKRRKKKSRPKRSGNQPSRTRATSTETFASYWWGDIKDTLESEFTETYAADWITAVQDALRGEDVYRTVEQAFQSPERKLPQLLTELDFILRNYVLKQWVPKSEEHQENGVYRSIVDFIGDQEGLLLDLGCGLGSFIAEWGRTPAIGVDLNGYALQLAERNIEQSGLPVKRYSKSTLVFNPKRGFEVKSLEGELYLEGVTLLNDDIAHLETTKKVLREKGVKADIVTLMLWGGGDGYEQLYFLDQNQMSRNYRLQQTRVAQSIMPILPDILNSGGRFYIASRRNVQGEIEWERSTGKSTSDMYQETFGSIGVVNRYNTIDTQEKGVTNRGKDESSLTLGLVEIVMK